MIGGKNEVGSIQRTVRRRKRWEVSRVSNKSDSSKGSMVTGKAPKVATMKEITNELESK